jgi:hypothetical protein
MEFVTKTDNYYAVVVTKEELEDNAVSMLEYMLHDSSAKPIFSDISEDEHKILLVVAKKGNSFGNAYQPLEKDVDAQIEKLLKLI